MQKGLVVKSTGSWYYVKDQKGKVIPCKIRGTYRIKGIRATNPVAVGDKVEYNIVDQGQSGLITEISTRENYLVRKSSKLSREYQLIAANIDQAILIVSLFRPKTLTEFIDRFLISLEAFRIPVIILINKTDLHDAPLKEEMEALLTIYQSAGYETIPISVHAHTNVDLVREKLVNKTTVISGNSGVGKSSLINAFDPSLDLKTNEISDHHKSGQHTTTFAEMFFLPDQSRIIDTPGIKGFGMIDIEKEELFHFFPEIFRASKDCRFHNCLHINEPGCAVAEQVKAGSISYSRYANYVSIMHDLDDKYRK